MCIIADQILLKQMRTLRSKRAFLPVVAVCLFLFCSFAPQEVRVNQKKIEREKIKKEKEAAKQYEQAVKRHNDNQSKATKKSMKQTKKESKKTIPINR